MGEDRAAADAERSPKPVCGLVLAAGAGARFGGPKQLARFAGRPLLEHVLAVVAAVPLELRIVVLGAEAERIEREVDLHGARPVRCPDWERGQSASLRTGIEAAAEAGAVAVAVALGDQPLLAPEAFRRVIAARGRAAAVRATYDGVPGHPVLLEAELFARAAALEGDTGARALLAGVEVADVACDGLGSPADVDTPERLQELERTRA